MFVLAPQVAGRVDRHLNQLNTANQDEDEDAIGNNYYSRIEVGIIDVLCD